MAVDGRIGHARYIVHNTKQREARPHAQLRQRGALQSLGPNCQRTLGYQWLAGAVRVSSGSARATLNGQAGE